MGDFKKTITQDAMDERESRGHLHKSVKNMVNKRTPASGKKDKVISAKVYPDMWDKFSQINKAQGMTNCSVINKLIAEYVRDSSMWLETE